jgi:outer membrane protein assembly factor BamB
MKTFLFAICGFAACLVLSACSQLTTISAHPVAMEQLEWLTGVPGGLGNIDGIGEAARFGGPLVLAADPRGGLLIADQDAHTVRRADADFRVTTIAGQSGIAAFRDGKARAARFNSPSGTAVAADGTIYVSDRDNNVIRRITADGSVSVFAGAPGEPPEADWRLAP